MAKELIQDKLIYGEEYDLWRDGIFIGTARFTYDPNMGGDCFLKEIMDDTGQFTRTTYAPDQWVSNTNGVGEKIEATRMMLSVKLNFHLRGC